MTGQTTPVTTADLDRMTRDDAWQGFGYLGERRHALDSTDPDAPARPERVADVDAWLVEHANTLDLGYDGLFAWANSRTGRYFADVVFGGGTIEQAVAWRLAPRHER